MSYVQKREEKLRVDRDKGRLNVDSVADRLNSKKRNISVVTAKSQLELGITRTVCEKQGDILVVTYRALKDSRWKKELANGERENSNFFTKAKGLTEKRKARDLQTHKVSKMVEYKEIYQEGELGN